MKPRAMVGQRKGGCFGESLWCCTSPGCCAAGSSEAYVNDTGGLGTPAPTLLALLQLGFRQGLEAVGREMSIVTHHPPSAQAWPFPPSAQMHTQPTPPRSALGTGYSVRASLTMSFLPQSLRQQMHRRPGA